MNIIAAVDKNWAIGYKGKLLVQIPADMKFFQQMTMGKVVLMGRKTLLTLPNSLPLIGRTNLVLTANPDFKVRGATILHSLDEAMEELKKYRDEDIFVIGGESIYRQFLPFCNTAHITKINQAYEADAYFPNLDEKKEWKITADSEEQTCFDIEYYFLKYEKR